MIKKISRVEQLPIINALVIINYTGTAAKSRRQAFILNFLVNNETTQQIFLFSALLRGKTGLIRNAWVVIRNIALI